jgi:hypothetical protein
MSTRRDAASETDRCLSEVSALIFKGPLTAVPSPFLIQDVTPEGNRFHAAGDRQRLHGGFLYSSMYTEERTALQQFAHAAVRCLSDSDTLNALAADKPAGQWRKKICRTSIQCSRLDGSQYSASPSLSPPSRRDCGDRAQCRPFSGVGKCTAGGESGLDALFWTNSKMLTMCLGYGQTLRRRDHDNCNR